MTCARGFYHFRRWRLLAVTPFALLACQGEPTKSAGSPGPGPSPAPPAGAVSLGPGAALQDSIARYPEGTFFTMGAGAYPLQSTTPKSGMTFQGAGPSLPPTRLSDDHGSDWRDGAQDAP